MGWANVFKRLIFTAAALVITLFVIESSVRVIEWYKPPAPVDARSPLAFQELPKSDPASIIRIDGLDHYSMVWPERIGQTLPVEKGDDEIRIVFVGGSQAVGLGVAQPATFAAWIQRLLNDSGDHRRVRVINMAKTGYASPQLTYLLENSIELFNPDLVVTVMGNNEFLDTSLAINPKKQAPLTFARKLDRPFALARMLRPKQKPAKEAKTDFVISKVKIPATTQFVEDRLRRSLRRMAYLAKKKGAGFMVCTVPVNLRFIHSRQWYFAGDGPEQDPDYI